MEKKYKILSVALFFIIFLCVFFLSHQPALAPITEQLQSRNIKFSSGAIISVEIADTPVEREKGLSGRQSMAENSGMLFVFPEPDNYSFWMKDMNFGLDFVWIKGDTVVEITPKIMPSSSVPLDVLSSREKIDKVLEVNAGTAERLGIKVGDKAGF